jgi:hypothetical protein
VSGPRPIPAPVPAPPLRRPHLALPAYRYVPGLHPHPFRDADGHHHLHEVRWPSPLWAPDGPWWEADAFQHGLDLFDQRFYWESHECWEAIWHRVDRAHVDRELVQALIQAAAFVIKRHVGADRAARHLLERATGRLGEVARRGGATWCGVDVARFSASLSAFDGGGPWPVIGRAA